MCDATKLEKETVEALYALLRKIESSQSELHNSFGSTRFSFTIRALAILTSIGVTYGFKRAQINFKNLNQKGRQRTEELWRAEQEKSLKLVIVETFNTDEKLFTERLYHDKKRTELNKAIETLEEGKKHLSNHQAQWIALFLLSTILFPVSPHSTPKIQLSIRGFQENKGVQMSEQIGSQAERVAPYDKAVMKESIGGILLDKEQNKITSEQAGMLIVAEFFKQDVAATDERIALIDEHIAEMDRIARQHPSLVTS